MARLVTLLAVLSLLLIPVTCASAAGPHSIYMNADAGQPSMDHMAMAGHHATAMTSMLEPTRHDAVPRFCAPGAGKSGKASIPVTGSELLVGIDATPPGASVLALPPVTTRDLLAHAHLMAGRTIPPESGPPR